MVRIRRSHRRGPGSIPGQGSLSSSSLPPTVHIPLLGHACSAASAPRQEPPGALHLQPKPCQATSTLPPRPSLLAALARAHSRPSTSRVFLFGRLPQPQTRVAGAAPLPAVAVATSRRPRLCLDSPSALLFPHGDSGGSADGDGGVTRGAF